MTRFEQSGLHWPLPEGFDAQQLQEKLYGPGWGKSERAAVRPLPDFEHIRHELATNRHTTLQLLWEEYWAAHPDGFLHQLLAALSGTGVPRWIGHTQSVT